MEIELKIAYIEIVIITLALIWGSYMTVKEIKRQKK